MQAREPDHHDKPKKRDKRSEWNVTRPDIEVRPRTHQQRKERNREDASTAADEGNQKAQACDRETYGLGFSPRHVVIEHS